MRKGLLVLCVFATFSVVLSGCEKNGNQFFRTKKGMDKQLSGTWESISPNIPPQEWSFDNGKIERLETGGNFPGRTDLNGEYTLNAGLFKTKITIVSMDDNWFNEPYDIIRLDDEFLVIFMKPALSGGSELLEFQKIPQ